MSNMKAASPAVVLYRSFYAIISCVFAAALFLTASTWFEAETYDRSVYGPWIDADDDCQYTRQEVLIQENLVQPTMEEANCRVLRGYWYDHYTEKYFSDPADIEVDHLVP
jgi:hypothetical protein